MLQPLSFHKQAYKETNQGVELKRASEMEDRKSTNKLIKISSFIKCPLWKTVALSRITVIPDCPLFVICIKFYPETLSSHHYPYHLSCGINVDALIEDIFNELNIHTQIAKTYLD